MKPRNGVKITIKFPDGEKKTFPSIAEAARNIGILRHEIHRYLRGDYKRNRKGYEFYV